MQDNYDVVIVGASFSGLTLAHHLPASVSVLMVDAKPVAGSSVESTGLITTKTYQEFKTFFDIDRYITNPISSICVVAPDFKTHFTSTVDEPWIYQTDTRGLIAELARTVPDSVTLAFKTAYVSSHAQDGGIELVTLKTAEGNREVQCKVLVGADGGSSAVAKQNTWLDRNTSFLFGFERVYFGSIHLGPNPAQTIYHYWFGEFSLGYGGWISPTIVNGRPAFRIGLAKLPKDRGEASGLLFDFTERLVANGTVTIQGDVRTPDYAFGSFIPMGGVRKRYTAGQTLLIGDAAGFCGAFAADGIKGSVVSGKEAALLIERALVEDACVLTDLHGRMKEHGGLLHYYRRQVRYRWVWDRMKRDRSFWAMFNIIRQEHDTFLDQFCDSKDTHRSLTRTVLKWRHVPRLMRYAWCLFLDLFV